MLRCPVNSLLLLSSAGTCCASCGPLRGEPPERRSCFSAFDIISFVSPPLSVTTTITAFYGPSTNPLLFSSVSPSFMMRNLGRVIIVSLGDMLFTLQSRQFSEIHDQTPSYTASKIS